MQFSNIHRKKIQLVETSWSQLFHVNLQLFFTLVYLLAYLFFEVSVFIVTLERRNNSGDVDLRE